MDDTITIQLPEPLSRRLRENDVPEQAVRTVVIDALQRWLDARMRRERVVPFSAEHEGEVPEGHEYFRRILIKMHGGVSPSDDELFVEGLTRGEYLALSEEEEKALWDKWFAEELDKVFAEEPAEDKAYYANADAVPAR